MDSIEKGLFSKMVSDANKMSGFYMDDYTASLLYDHFYEIETEELQSILKTLLRNGEKVTYKSILLNLKAKKKEKTVEKPIKMIYEGECKDNCKTCTKMQSVCIKMHIECWKIFSMIMNNEMAFNDALLVLHEKYPTAGFNKKIGRCTGVIGNENGEHIPVYKYD